VEGGGRGAAARPRAADAPTPPSSLSPAAQTQADLTKSATSFATTFKEEVKKGLDEAAKAAAPPPGGPRAP